MEITERYDISLCVDCYMTSQGVHEAPDEVVPEPLGKLPNRSSYFAQYVKFTSAESEAHFSWHPCQGCGSTLGGDRFDVELLHLSN